MIPAAKTPTSREFSRSLARPGALPTHPDQPDGLGVRASPFRVESSPQSRRLVEEDVPVDHPAREGLETLAVEPRHLSWGRNPPSTNNKFKDVRGGGGGGSRDEIITCVVK